MRFCYAAITAAKLILTAAGYHKIQRFMLWQVNLHIFFLWSLDLGMTLTFDPNK